MKLFTSILIQRKWRAFVSLGYNTRENNQDGLEVWSEHSVGLNDSNSLEWSSRALSLLDELQELGVDQNRYNKDTQHEEWEQIHFLYQLGAIPHHKDASIKNLMQVAYNYGSALFVANEKKVYDKQSLDKVGFRSLDDPMKFIKL